MDNNKNMKRFFKILFSNNKSTVILAFLVMLVASIIDLFIPQITRMILDSAISGRNVDLLIKLVLLYASVSIFSSLITVVLEYIYLKIKKRVSTGLKIKILRHLSKLSGSYYSNIKTGNILSIIESDIFMVENFGIDIIFSLVSNIVTALVALSFLIKMDMGLLIGVISIQVLLIIVQIKFTKVISLKTEEVRERNGEISNIVQEYVSNIINVVTSKSVLKFFKKYIKQEKSLINKRILLDMIIYSNISISRVLSSLITIFIYGYGGLKIINESMSIGELVSFQQYTAMLIGPCMNIIMSNTRIQQSLVSINRVFSILDEPITIQQNNHGNNIEKSLNRNLVFKDVDFYYDEDKILDSINIEFERDKVTAIVGTSGSGKSTLVNLIFRLWDTNKGKISIDDIDIKEYNLNSLRKNISIVTQDLLLFDDSILNNLTLGNEKIRIEHVKDICDKVGINNFINELPNGFDTPIGEKGIKLSGGQKQRVAIARALISESSIIIFDEATSALDNISQQTILENINSLLKGKIVIVIAHRLSTVRDADKIYVIDKGKVIESGSHEELILNEGTYYNLLNGHTLDLAIS